MEAGRDVVIAVDLGGTNLRVAAVGPDGSFAARHREPTASREGPEAVIERLIAAVDRVAGQAREAGAVLHGIAVGAPGVIDSRRGLVVCSPNLTGWREVPLRERVRAAAGVPVILENDANAAAFGEHWLGAGSACETMVMITLGTGVGGGLVLRRELWRGIDGMAGEVGHLTVEPGGPTCRCGNSGCLEGFASATGIVERYRELSGSDHPLTAEEVHRLASDGDHDARQSYREAGRALGIVCASLVNLLNPERIVIGGGVLPAWDFFVPAADQEMRRRAFDAPAERVVFVPATLGDEAGMTGAAGLLWRELAGARGAGG